MDKIKQSFFLRACIVLLFVCAHTVLWAQNTNVTGSVKDSNGEPLIGVTIQVQGTKSGVITDLDGNFTLSCSPNAILTVNYIGYKSQNIALRGRGRVDVVLESTSKDLNEVVVVGYGTQKKVNITGAVSVVGSEQLENRPVANVSQALQGTVPGLNFTPNNNGGMLDNSMSFRIRGTGSIGNGSSDAPLVLIDGIEGDINTLNPNDIESISVLKDAASSSIYGTRAAFGVLLVTTKSGKAGKVRINYSGDVRFSTATQLPKMANSLEWARYFNQASRNAGGNNIFSNETMDNIVKYMNGEFTDPSDPHYYGTLRTTSNSWSMYGSSFANTDWFKEYYKSGVPSTQHNLSFSGGNEKVNWVLSTSYFHNNGLIRHGHDKMDRYTFNAKINAQLADWARVEYATKWIRQDYSRPQYLSGLFFHNIARRWPTIPVRDPNGRYMAHAEIYELEDGGEFKRNRDLFTQQLNFTFNPLEGWNIHANGSLRTNNQKATTSRIPISVYDADNNPVPRDSGYGLVSDYTDNRFRQDYYTVNIFTDYTRSFGEHNLKGLLGLNYERYNQDDLSASGKNLVNTEKPYLNQAQSDFAVGDNYWLRATAGYFGRINYDYAEKYIAEFNIRYDGSSRFTSDRRWAWFPSASAGWNIARESFFKHFTDVVSNLKLRASWGQLGNTSSEWNTFWDWYPFYQQQSIGTQNSNWLVNGNRLNTATLPAIVNSSMTWETVETWDIGFDFSAFNNRLNGTFDWYTRKTKDMIGPAPILGSVLGADAPRTNNCDMRSNGWELELSWRDQIGKVKYNVKLNLSDATSKILRYPYEGKFENQGINGYYNGKKLNEIWGYESVGLARTQEEMDAWLANNRPSWGNNWGAGDVMYKNIADRYDANGNVIDQGVVSPGASTLGDHGDLKVIGNTTPRYNFGVNLGAEYAGFDFSIFFQGVMKRDWYFSEGQPYFWGTTGNMWQSTVFKDHLDYWTEDNPNAYYPKPYFGGIQKNQRASSRYLQNAAYLRCKNLQFGYTIPQKFIAKAGLSQCRVYFSADNLFTITSLVSIFDPESLGGAWGNGKLYPLQRTLSFGLNVSF